MRIFISWSGELSQKLGEEFSSWLPAVLQSVKPYFTPSDIEKGSRWNSDIAKELEISKIGLFIYTRDNLNSPWMMFEAGAISKTLDNSKVCPILFGLENSDFKGPLTQFQTSQFNKQDIKKLIKTINYANDLKLEDSIIEEVFEMWWPKLENRVGKILERKSTAQKTIRTDRDLLEEMLELTRYNASSIFSIRKSRNKQANYDIDKFQSLVKSFVYETISLFDEDWDHTKSILEDSISKYINMSGNFLEPNIEDEGKNWINRYTYLESFRRLKDFMSENDIMILNKFSKEDVPF